MASPYAGFDQTQWKRITDRLIHDHPLQASVIVAVVLNSWQSLFDSKIGTREFQIGKDFFPKPQVMGFFLEQLITLDLSAQYPDQWRAEKSADEKDIVYIPNAGYSVEIKTSSSPKHIYGNRSYAQEGNGSKKSKSGYVLAVNFQKFTNTTEKPMILRVRFGWLDHTDWIGQTAPTGQQSRVKGESETLKLQVLYPPAS